MIRQVVITLVLRRVVRYPQASVFEVASYFIGAQRSCMIVESRDSGLNWGVRSPASAIPLAFVGWGSVDPPES